jgi:hypothetical protein
MEAATDSLKNRMAKLADALEKKVGPVPFVQNLKRIGQQGVPGVGNAPYFVVVKERKGMPPVLGPDQSWVELSIRDGQWLPQDQLGSIV